MFMPQHGITPFIDVIQKLMVRDACRKFSSIFNIIKPPSCRPSIHLCRQDFHHTGLVTNAGGRFLRCKNLSLLFFRYNDWLVLRVAIANFHFFCTIF